MNAIMMIWIGIAGSSSSADFLCYNPPVLGPAPTMLQLRHDNLDLELTFTYMLYDSGTIKNVEIINLNHNDMEVKLLPLLRLWKFMVPPEKPQNVEEPYRCITHLHIPLEPREEHQQ